MKEVFYIYLFSFDGLFPFLGLPGFLFLKISQFKYSEEIFSDIVSLMIALSFINLGILILTLLIGGGTGLVLVGVYEIAKKNTFGGLVNIIIGVAAITLSVLYIAVEGFRDAFWIIVGVLVAIYGVLVIVGAFLGKKK